ncbi:MAG: M48 family metallopeptidase [Alphaproteobacteria bacterium]
MLTPDKYPRPPTPVRASLSALFALSAPSAPSATPAIIALIALLSLISLSACIVAPKTQTPTHSSETVQQEERYQRQLALNENFKLNQKLQSLAWPILTANIQYCNGKTSHAIPIEITQKNDVPKEWQEAWSDTFSNTNNPVVSAVWVTNAPLQVKDQILTAKNQNPVQNSNGDDANPNQSLTQKIAQLVKDGNTLQLTILRDSQKLQISLTPTPVCDFPVILKKDKSLNASATGNSIHFNSGFIKRAPDDLAIAVVLGHELAHNTRKHTQAQQLNSLPGILAGAVIGILTGNATNINKTTGGLASASIGGTLSSRAYSQDFENEADYIGLYHTARAGYDVSNAADLWRWFATNASGTIGLRQGRTHPSSVERYLNVENVAKEIANKKNKGLPLIPQEGQRSTNSETNPESENQE